MKLLKISILLSIVVLLTHLGCQKNLQTNNHTNNSLEAEKEAIRQVVALESSAYYKQDFETWKSTFVDAPHFRLYGFWEGYPEKVVYHNGFQSLKDFKKKQFEENRTLWQKSRIERTNENFRIYPNVAWYTFEESTFDATTNKLLGTCLGARLMEKHNGQWKIAYLGFHFLPLKENNAALSTDTSKD